MSRFSGQCFAALAIVLAVVTPALAQTDTVRYLHYNLLNYGNSANRPAVKNPRLTTILQYVQPDIVSCNEILSDSTLRDSLLTVLGSGWSKTPYSNQGGQTQTNTLFFRTSLFQLRSQTVISSTLRDIISYRLHYRDTITHPHDTVTLTVIVCHPKAGQTSADEADRAAEMQTVATYLNAQPAGNILLAGDLNVYESAEQAYQNLVANPNVQARLYDPINRPGAWHDNSAFADIHTQSPRATNLSDGGATGGLDDRFDQILVSSSVVQDVAGMKYLPGSYKAIGQDGQHFNTSIIDAPTNTSAPATVIQALHLASDHLPVTADFILHTSPLPTGIPYMTNYTLFRVTAVNPVEDDLVLYFPVEMIGKTVSLQMHSIFGKLTVQTELAIDGPIISRSVSDLNLLPYQLYILTIQDEAGNVWHTRLQKGH